MPKGHYEHQPRNDLTGQTFGDWTVLGRGRPRGRSGRQWLCQCVCGTEREVASSSLKGGTSTGCGCAAAKRFADGQVTHGKSRTPEYRTWIAMRARCQNPNNTKWALYGGRGIKVCDRWDTSFEAFLADMGERPAKHSIERVDGDGNYEPSNCVWAPVKNQNRNTARNHYLTHGGATLTVAEWAEQTGMSYGALSTRIRDGWTVEDALTIPVGRGTARTAHRERMTH